MAYCLCLNVVGIVPMIDVVIDAASDVAESMVIVMIILMPVRAVCMEV